MKIFNFMFHTVKIFTSAWEQKTQNVMENGCNTSLAYQLSSDDLFQS